MLLLLKTNLDLNNNLNFLLLDSFFIFLILLFIVLILLFNIYYSNKLINFYYLNKYYLISSNRNYRFNGYLDLINSLIKQSLFFLFGLLFLSITNNYFLLNTVFNTLYDNYIITFNNFFNLFSFFLILMLLYYFLLFLVWLSKNKLSSDYILVLWFSIFSLFLLIYSINLFYIFLNLEILSLTFYVLISSKLKSLLSIEASVKYLILSILSSSLFLLGISFLYFYFGSLNLTNIYSLIFILESKMEFFIYFLSIFFVFCGISFKLGIVPFHTWVPDVYEGSSLIFTVFISLLPKLIYTLVLYKLIYFFNIFYLINYNYLFLLLGILSLIIGTLGALNQIKIKRFLAYSSISNMSYIYFSLLINNFTISFFISIIYLIIYLIISFILFSILVLLFNNEVINIFNLKLSMFNNYNSMIIFFWACAFLSMAGIPPFPGFFSKFLILKSLVLYKYYFLFIIILVFNSISIYYYLRFIIISFFLPTILSFNKKINILNIIKSNNKLYLFFFVYLNFFNFFIIFFLDSFLELIFLTFNFIYLLN